MLGPAMPDRSAPMANWGPSRVDPTQGWFDRLSAIANPRRLAILAALRDAGELPIGELAARVADRERDAGAEIDGDASPATLYHAHLPKLVDADVVEVTEDADGTEVGPGPAFEDEVVEALERAVGSGAIDEAVVSALEEPRRRRALWALSTAGGSMRLDELAGAVSASGAATPSDGPTPDVSVMLHHVDLPKLAAAGIVDYEPESHLVTCRGFPDALSAVLASR